MKIKSALIDAGVMLGLDEVTAALESEDQPTGDAADEIKRLVRCANLVIGELAADLMPLKTRETLSFSPSAEYSAFSKPPTDIYSVKNESGFNVPFREYFDRVEVKTDGKYEVEYSYSPAAVALDGDIPFPALPPFVLAQGIAREYCVISGMTEEASVWDQRFGSSVAARVRPKKDVRIRRRAWV